MIAPPDDMTDRPIVESSAQMDPLSEVIRSIRLVGGLFLDAHFTAPWSVLSHITPAHCNLTPALPVQIIGYHVVLDGTLKATLDGKTIEVGAGEAVLFPRANPHVLGSAVGLPTYRASDLVKAAQDDGLGRIDYGGGGDPVHIVCGFLASETLYNPLIASLPGMLKSNVREGASRDWVEASVRFAAEELTKGRVASSGLISKLSELLLVEAVRDYAATLGQQEIGWLKGLSDSQVGRALALIHQDPARPWSAESLAKEVGLSRSAFFDRFAALVGQPPMRYLTGWRLQTAKLTLRESRPTIAQLAYSVGYESEEAFSRAFKREFGLSPAHWRDSPEVGY
jgi:AraC-like DNA-binding protein